eukprot:gnl/TRDRNA2_/TRDRNA2_176861_c0_seq2.p1 gnl/TRDRNA2_/TRDRNA2_176861_c0~~gnl/TRDRNA2_/TRDRNA2_176861_c0_seq2.p1  ORF type:complete len:226 (+),score=38.57 gnl/TRDRNA2_/TRDRNA2_176861_c0_seq2:55-732(+)
MAVTSATTSLRLTYLNIKGFAEPIRLALFIGGIDFEDRRIGYEWINSNRHDLPFGQVPVLEENGKMVGAQSAALLRWAGRRSGLYPEGQELQCDMVEDALADIKARLLPQWYGVVMGRHPVSGEPLVPMSDEQKVEVERLLNEVILPQRFAQLERLLATSDGPYFCGSRLATCDLSFYVMATGLLDGTYAAGIRPSIFDECPLLRALWKNIGDHSKVKEWNAKHE